MSLSEAALAITREHHLMDLQKAIHALLVERQRIDQIIGELEQLQKADGGSDGAVQPKRRGRKSMNEQERREVSQRMKRYWAERRQGHSSL